MINRLGLNKILWGITSVLALSSGVLGVMNPAIYEQYVSPDFLAGTVSQDIVTILLAAVVLILLPGLKAESWIKQTLILSIMGYFFYGYGIWVIEQIYTPYYLLYLAVFGISFYTMVINISNIRPEVIKRVTLPKSIRYLSVSWALFNPLVFYPLWISQLLPLMAGQPIESGFSIYILDISFIMPAFIILAIMSLKGHGLGLLLMPALFAKGFTLLLSVALGPIIAPLLGLSIPMGEVPFYLGLSLVFLVLTVVHLRGLEVVSNE